MKKVKNIDNKKTGVFLSVFLFLVMAVICPMSANAANNKNNTMKQKVSNTFATPDFAFPETVGLNAEKELDSALTKGDDVNALRAAMQLAISRNLVSNDNYADGIRLFDELSHKLKAPYSQLAMLLKAQIYASIYNSSPWTFNNRSIPMTPVPENVMEWSRDIFANTITGIVESTFADVDAARSTSISAISSIIENGQDAEKSGMMVYDFMTLKSGELLSAFANNGGDAKIPFGSVTADGNKKLSRSASELRNKIVDDNIAWHEQQGDMHLASVMSYYKLNNMPWQDRSVFLARCVKIFIDTPYCAAFLYEEANDNSFESSDEDGSEKSRLQRENAVLKKRYAKITDYLSRFPDCDNHDALKNKLTQLAVQQIGASVEGRIYPGEQGKINVSASNEFDFYVLAVKLPSSYINKGIDLDKIKGIGSVASIVKVNFKGEVPVKFEEKFDLPALKSGVYVLVPSRNNSLSGVITGNSPRQTLSTFTVSRLASFKTTGDGVSNDNRLYVVDGKNQQPVAGAKVEFTPYYNNGTKNQKIERVTNTDGYVNVPEGSFNILISKGSDLVAGDVWTGRYHQSRDKFINGEVLTDLSIYHPGDSVGFVGILFEQNNRELKQCANLNVSAKLYDANDQEVDSLRLKSDRFGRLSGKFRLPENGLLGQYSIQLVGTDKDSHHYADSYFEVAEYKSPTFYVECDGAEDGYKVGDVIRIKGKALTYSGMPVSDSSVKFDVKYMPLRWLNSGVNASYGGEVTTSADGSFVIELPTEGLRGTRYAFGGYQLNIAVTNPAGETQEAPATWFSLGEAFSIDEQLPERICADNGSVNYSVSVSDIVGKPVKKTVYYRISRYDNDGDVVKTGEFESPVFSFDAGELASGRYKIRFSLTDSEVLPENEHPIYTIVTVYRNDEKKPPYEVAVWSPVERIIAEKGAKKVKVNVGSSYSDSHIFMQVSDCDKILDQKWLKVNGGMVEIEIPAPAANNIVKVSFAGMHDFRAEMTGVSIIPKAQTEQIKIKAESFRDRITPGAKESWKFKFTLADAALAGIPVSAVMSNKALNAIEPFRWNFNPEAQLSYTPEGSVQWVYFNRNGSWTMQLSRVNYAGVKRTVYPAWDLYGFSLYGGADRMMMRKMKVRGTGSVAEELSGSVNGVYYAASVKNEMKEMAVEDSYAAGFDLAEPTAVTSGVEADGGGSQSGEDVVLRQVECPLAFFMPEQITDAEGNAIVDFTVPEFNGTWQFQIMGYTAEMKNAVSVMDAVASKPVMAQMNAPRFVRTGDKVSVSAMIYNNGLESMPLNGKIELFEVASGRVLASYVSEPQSVEPAGSCKISLRYDVPDNLNYLGIRVYGYGGNFADGEQTVIPVYPSSTPVLESKPFYIAPGQEEFSMKLPSFGKDAKVTLQYCDNPIWEVVTALPDISDPQSSNVLAQVNSLYGNAIGAGLAKDYPEIIDAINIFADPANSADSTFVSNLEKNQDLKNVLLNNTPWVRSAASETMRMQSLVKYADTGRSESIIGSTLKEIAKLQNGDGGWSWCAGIPSSDYITARVLLHLGMLRSMNYLPAEAETMAKKAIAYVDAEWVKMLKEYKGKSFPYASMMNYLYVRSAFADVAETPTFASMAKKGVKAVMDEWKEMGIYEKATAAILLSRSGYEMEARTVLESLRQYASFKEDKGMWFDNLSSSFGGWNKLITTAQVLEAYSEIEPQSANIDKLRQWLLITKQVENWGDNRETAEVIHAILTSGSKWTAPSEPATILIGGKVVDVDRVSALTGSITVQVNAKDKGDLTIKRSGCGPAWGGLISQYVAPIEKVKSASTSELSIEKALYAITNDADGTTAKAGDLRVGDKVRVTLTVVADRDLEYVAVMDARSACLEPAEQVSGYYASDGVWMYKEVRDNSTNLFIPFLPKGTHVISYECYVDRAGEYSLGIASAQSQYAPTIAAHTAGTLITVAD